jgi:hypothetical protein
MPKILEDAVKQIKKRGASTSSAWAMATASLQKAGDLKKGHNTATAKGESRGNMTRAQRHRSPP